MSTYLCQIFPSSQSTCGASNTLSRCLLSAKPSHIIVLNFVDHGSVRIALAVISSFPFRLELVYTQMRVQAGPTTLLTSVIRIPFLISGIALERLLSLTAAGYKHATRALKGRSEGTLLYIFQQVTVR